MEDYTRGPESGKPEESASGETRATKNVRKREKRAPLHDAFSRRDLMWRREGTDYVVYCGRRRLLRLVPDAIYPGMWRVAYPDGELGDLKNLTWARHEGARVALSLLNKTTVPGTSQRSPLTASGTRRVSMTAANGDARQSPLKQEEESFAVNCKAASPLGGEGARPSDAAAHVAGKRKRAELASATRGDRAGGSMKQDRNNA